MDSLILCKFLRGVLGNDRETASQRDGAVPSGSSGSSNKPPSADDKLAAMAEMLNLVTGWDVTVDELRETAQRIVTAKKLFNIRQGWTPAEDTLPDRFFAQPLADGPRAGSTLSRDRFHRLINAYNQARGWSSDGWPTDSQVSALPVAKG
jgi:aldehyde:ferredoxin oxidoreductase